MFGFRFRNGQAAALLAAAVLLTVPGCTGPGAGQAPATSGPASGGGSSAGTASPGPPGVLPVPAANLSIPQVVKEVEPSVVTITTQAGIGSGVIYRGDGSIVTDAHVVEDQQRQPFKSVRVQLADGTQTNASVIAVDDPTDVAVIKADRSGLPAARFSTATPEVGALTVVIGTPLGLEETVTSGIVSGLHRNMPPSREQPQGALDLIQTDAPISPGNSGGAVADATGAVIGLSEAYLPPSSGAVAIGFVTPSATVTNVADQLLKNGKASHAVLGLVPADLSPEIVKRFNLATTTGALVIQVSPAGPADKAGIRAGDIITSVAGQKITQVTDLLAALRKAQPGQQVDLTARRGTDTKTFTATLANTSGTG
ncbi:MULTISPECIES: trypsin-like peptidase domain-containing protein [Arthrobacter]|uniref:S1C family serine protease n=1 Tax=Arthrobacter TaxID=1663 RepID=UPI00254D5228|nr:MULTISPECIES: trypsin-like peptidase domain-containing protein [Arthrobacter]MDQ0242278.1 S1-C subfamily serine protease [Arthrobacter bambusae]